MTTEQLIKNIERIAACESDCEVLQVLHEMGVYTKEDWDRKLKALPDGNQ